MWGKITLEPAMGVPSIKDGIKQAYKFMMDNKHLSDEWEFSANGAKIPMTIFDMEFMATYYRRPPEIHKDFLEAMKNG